MLAPPLWAALVGLLLVFLIVPQLPLRYNFDVGHEEGVGSDLPFLQGFNTAERDELGSYRWSDDGARIVVPGVGQRDLLVRLTWLPTPAAVAPLAPREYELLAGDRSLGRLPLRPEGGTQLVTVPAAALAHGRLELTIRTSTFTLPGDPRALGARLGGFELVGLSGGLPRAPDWGAALSWLAAVALGWLAVRHCFAGWGNREGREGREGAQLAFGPAEWTLLVGAVLVAMAAVLDPPRWAFGAWAALAACGLGYGLAVAMRATLPALARRLRVPLDGASLGWLCLFVVLSFGLRYGGRLYPNSMHGDIGFHHNRFNETIWGLIYIVSVNRGVEFPYPPGPYAVVAPLTLLGLAPPTVLQLCAALFDALSAVVVYAIGTRVAGQRTALLAAGIYVFTAATFMASWWSFSTHIFSQFFFLLLVATLLWALAAWQERGPGWSWGVGVAWLLLGVVFLGHFGFLINTALMAGLALGVVWVLSWRGQLWAQRVRWPFTLALVGAGLFAAACFYSAYIPLFLGQIATAQEGGLAAVADREPVSRAVMWERLWRDGLLIHFGLFPLLLLPWGLWRIWRAGRAEQGLGARRAVALLMAASLSVATLFALFPFVAGVTNSPRWMLFIAWAVAVGAAVAGEALWRRGRWGRLAMLAMGVVVLANTAWIWLGPMLWRIRPPEPF